MSDVEPTDVDPYLASVADVRLLDELRRRFPRGMLILERDRDEPEAIERHQRWWGSPRWQCDAVQSLLNAAYANLSGAAIPSSP